MICVGVCIGGCDLTEGIFCDFPTEPLLFFPLLQGEKKNSRAIQIDSSMNKDKFVPLSQQKTNFILFYFNFLLTGRKTRKNAIIF